MSRPHQKPGERGNVQSTDSIVARDTFQQSAQSTARPPGPHSSCLAMDDHFVVLFLIAIVSHPDRHKNAWQPGPVMAAKGGTLR
jgi:hypothetical protein